MQDIVYTRLLEALLNNRENSRAQLLQDVFALYFSGFKQKGFFVEFGATNGLSLSNTYALEKHFDWDGILAEPLPTWHADLRKNRECAIDTRCVYSQSNLKMQFVDAFEAPELSGLQNSLQADHNQSARVNNRTFEVNTVSLMDLLDQYAAPASIDYLSIDTEGSELEILNAFDFTRYQVSVLTVEHNYVEPQRASIKALLEKAGFVRVCEGVSRWDDWYVHHLNPVLAGPAT